MSAVREWQLTRNSLLWLLLAFFSNLALHISVLPIWITLLAIVAAGWRILHYRGRLAFPNTSVKVVFVLLICAGLVLQFQSPLGLEPMLALFSAGYALKLLEMHSKRDVLLVIFLGYFLSATACLFSQEIAKFLLVLGCFLLTTAALNAVSQGHNRRFNAVPLRIAAASLLVSIPLMLVLFMVMPRLGAIWSVPGPTGQAKTGIGSTVAPGDFSKLSRSAEVAFRVEFDGAIPPPKQRYWRGLVMSSFDGRAWSQEAYFGSGSPIMDERTAKRLVVRRGEPLRYKVTLEPNYSRWFFSLPYASSSDSSLIAVRDFRLASTTENQFRRSFLVTSWLDYQLEPIHLDPQRERLERRIPSGFNPQTQTIARQWATEEPDAQALMKRLLTLFNERFVYTLEPPALGTHSVDEFLWDTQRGFCEHFASSFVFFMRAAGYPARVVAGYQGGEVHPTEGFLTVRQYDAHAWAEVWLAGEGWVRVDPTAAVAPERIEAGFDEMFNEQDYLAGSPLSLMRFKNIGVINWLRLRLDYLDYAWATWVLGYEQQQYEFLSKLLGQVNATRTALLLLGGALLTIIPVILWSMRDRIGNRPHPLDNDYLLFCKKAAAAGYHRLPGEGPAAFAERLQTQFPHQKEAIQDVTSLYIHARYDSADTSHLKQLRTLIRAMKFT